MLDRLKQVNRGGILNGDEIMPNITVDVKVRFVGPNEFYYEQRLLPVESDHELASSEDETPGPDLRFVIPSRSNGPYPHSGRFYQPA